MRFHVNIQVEDLQKSIAFYSAIFGTDPSKQKSDYAKWSLEDPKVNFSISLNKSGNTGIEHLGIEADSPEDLALLYTRVDKAEGELREEGETVCCYAKSTKGWVKDPQGVEWEMFHTHGESETFYGSGEKAACCQPVGETEVQASCC